MAFIPPPLQPPPMQPDDDLPTLAVRVEALLGKLGLDITASRLMGIPYAWQFQRGSALVEIRLIAEGDQRFFQISAPVMHLPHDRLLHLYRRLLELNFQMVGAAFAVYRDAVYLLDERPTTGLDEAEMHAMITTVAGFADQMDDELVNEFGGRRYGQA